VQQHGSARLSIHSRHVIALRVEKQGWSVTPAALAAGVSRQTASKWVQRFRVEGSHGLGSFDPSLRPRGPQGPRAADRVSAPGRAAGTTPDRLGSSASLAPRSMRCSDARVSHVWASFEPRRLDHPSFENAIREGVQDLIPRHPCPAEGRGRGERSAGRGRPDPRCSGKTNGTRSLPRPLALNGTITLSMLSFGLPRCERSTFSRRRQCEALEPDSTTPRSTVLSQQRLPRINGDEPSEKGPGAAITMTQLCPGAAPLGSLGRW
jgi:hypothetical protein